VLSACGGTKTVVRTVTVRAPSTFGASPQEVSYYGHIVSLTSGADGYLLRFDPSWWLSGITANVAAAAAQHVTCAPSMCEPVPNDHFILDEGHTTLTFVMPRSTHGTVLTSGANINGTRIDATRLAAIVAAGNTAKLFESLDSGVWIRVHNDTVQAFAQQYRP
jgi:hypothetical protein